jgi:citrate lyase subunit beta/citryl-CoA lyase
MMERALGINKKGKVADVVILDLEDSISPVSKVTARENVLNAMQKVEFFRKNNIRKPPTIAVRINCAITTDWGRADIELLSKIDVDAVVVPKVNSAAELEATKNLIGSPIPAGLDIWPMIETANGVLNAHEIAKFEHVHALVFGSNDLTKDLRAYYTADRLPLLYSMSKCILEARAAGKLIIDGVFMNIKDEVGFRAECIAGKNLGFDGERLLNQPDEMNLPPL